MVLMQMPESNLNIKTPTRHLLKVICGFDTRFILKFIPQITWFVTDTGDSFSLKPIIQLNFLSIYPIKGSLLC
jgi:hypothetical protein